MYLGVGTNVNSEPCWLEATRCNKTVNECRKEERVFTLTLNVANMTGREGARLKEIWTL